MTPDFMGTLPGWITAGSTTTGVIALIAAYWRRGISLKGLQNADEADIRDHYAQEVAALRAELNQQERNFREVETHLRSLLEASDKRHEECEAARADSRREVAGLHREIEGMRRQIVRYSAEGVLVLSEQQPSPMVEAAAKRVRKIVEDGGK